MYTRPVDVSLPAATMFTLPTATMFAYPTATMFTLPATPRADATAASALFFFQTLHDRFHRWRGQVRRGRRGGGGGGVLQLLHEVP